MKSKRSFLLAMVLSLAVLAGCNVTVNEAPETTESAGGQPSVSTDAEMPAVETTEEESDTEEPEDSESSDSEEESESGAALELNTNLKPLEVVPMVISDDPTPDVGDIKIITEPLVIDISE
ncbi:hypothetical protein JXD20_03195 [Candidatus Peregrinibacteria bacterium]|nr:hypothetical protein [Candidatus Peregrinibacteria bacterium]